MKKNTTVSISRSAGRKTKTKVVGKGTRRKTKVAGQVTVGVDLGDRSSRYCMVNEQGDVGREGGVATTRRDLNRVLGRCRTAGSRWKWVRIRPG